MWGFLRRHVKVIAGAAVVGLGVSAALAVATVPDNNGVFHSCVKVLTIAGSNAVEPDPTGPNLRIIDPEPPASQTCDPAAKEMPLDFNQRGPTGPSGAPGPQGPGGGGGGSGATIGHLTLKGNPTLSGDFCAARLVRLGAVGSTRGQSQAGTTEFELTRVVDSLSPKLSKATTSGTEFKTATIQIFSPSATFKLGNAAISTDKIGLGTAQPLEELTLVGISKKGA
ncbi:MAG: type VI secretion system tube protein Hcp [Solirubrobacterales bacterium]